MAQVSRGGRSLLARARLLATRQDNAFVHDGKRFGAVLAAQQGSTGDPGANGGGHAGALAAFAAAAALLPWSIASADAKDAQRPRQAAPPPASGAPAALDERGLTNNPLDYDPITNEHTARMTMARKAALEAYENGRFKEAERRFQEAIREAQLGFPEGDPHIPSAKHNLAEFYRNTGRHEEAGPLYDEALADLRDAFGEEHWLYASALVNKALLEEAAGRHAAAQALLERALALRGKMFSTASFVYADTASTLARCLAAQGGKQHQARAAALYAQAIATVEESGNVEGTPVIEWQLALAEMQAGPLRQPGAAAATLAACMAHMAAAHGEVTARASEVNERLADAQAAAGRRAEALATMTQLVEARSQAYGQHLVVALSMNRLAAMHLQPPRSAEALALADHFSSSAATIAKQAAAAAKAGGGWLDRLRGRGPGAEQRREMGVKAELELGRAYQMLCQVRQAQGQLGPAIEAGRQAVAVLRQAQAAALEALKAAAAEAGVESPAVDRLSGVLVDARLSTLEALEGLAAALRAAAGGGKPAASASVGEDAADEVRQLLLEAELLAGEMYGD